MSDAKINQIFKRGKEAAEASTKALVSQLEIVNQMAISSLFLGAMVKNIGMDGSQEEAEAFSQDIITLVGDLRDQTENLLRLVATYGPQNTYDENEK